LLLTRQQRRISRPRLNMAAMIDVVFLLLIFFMCTAAFVKREDRLPSRALREGAVAADALDQLEPIRLRLSGADDRVVVECDGRAVGTFAELVQMLRARRAIADVPVIIEGQGSVPFVRMVGALDACYQAGLPRAGFSTKGFD